MKPVCKNFGADGNVFFMAAQVTRTLKKAGMHEQAKEFNSKLWKCADYDSALQLMMEYVEVELEDEKACEHCDCEDDD